MARILAAPALKASVVKRWVTAFALLAFFLQGLAVQTHVHVPLQPVAAKTASLPEQAPLKAQDPIDQCRLCQEVAHAGIFVAPSASAVAISLTFALAVFAARPDVAPRSATAFGWQSRAPPRR
jgi:hypothetical protein